MEPESSSPYSQAPATCPYPEPTLSSTHNPFPLPEDPSLYYPPIYFLVSPMVSFPQVSPPNKVSAGLIQAIMRAVPLFRLLVL